MQGLIGPLKELAEFEELCINKKKDAGMIRVCGCVNSQKSHMMYALGDGCKYKVIACSSETKAKQIYEEYRFLDSNTYLYPAKDFLFYQADIRSKELVKQRMEGIQAVLSGEPVTVVTSLDGFMDHLAPKESIAEKVLKIQNDSILKLDEMAEKLSVIGYDREVQVEGPGQFAVRGGILDIYPLTEELPVRIELWGDEVDSIRTFDVESQRSIENLMDIVIYPAVEFPQNGEKGVSFLDYFPPEDTILFLDEPVRLVERGQNIEEEFLEAQKKRLENGYELEEEEAKIFPVADILKKIKAFLPEDQIFFPCILLIIAGNDGCDRIQCGLFELRSDCLGNVFRCVGCHVVHTFLQCIGESLDDFRMFVDVTLLCRESSVRNIAAVRSKRGDNVSLTLFFKIGCTRFEFYGEVVIGFVFCEGSRSRTEINILVDGEICSRIDMVLV